jgi:hypothetical protein
MPTCGYGPCHPPPYNSGMDRLPEFERYVRAAPTDAESERIVRTMLGRFAKSCPMDVLVQLAQCVIDCRRAELRDEAGRN